MHAAVIMILMSNVNAFCGDEQLHQVSSSHIREEVKFNIQPPKPGAPSPNGSVGATPPSQPIMLFGAFGQVASYVKGALKSVSQIVYDEKCAYNYVQRTTQFACAAGAYTLCPPLGVVLVATSLAQQVEMNLQSRYNDLLGSIVYSPSDHAPIYPATSFHPAAVDDRKKALPSQHPKAGRMHTSSDDNQNAKAGETENDQDEDVFGDVEATVDIQLNSEPQNKHGKKDEHKQKLLKHSNSQPNLTTNPGGPKPHFRSLPHMRSNQEEYQWVPTISAAVTVSVGVGLIKLMSNRKTTPEDQYDDEEKDENGAEELY